MNEPVKINQKISRKTVLLLSGIIERCLTGNAAVGDLLRLVPPEDVESLQAFSDECLSRACLKELHDKLKQLEK